MVPDLVAEMAEQAAIRLGQFRAPPLDLGAVGLGERNRHHAVVVPGHHLGCGGVRRIGQKLERQTVTRILGAGLERQLPAKQTIEEPVLGEFDVPPSCEMRGLRDVGNRVVVPAGDAEPVPPFGRRQPVASVIIRIGAEAARATVSRQGRPAFAARGLERGHDFELGNIGEPMAAAPAGSILEINDVVANLAAKQFHRTTLSRMKRPKRARRPIVPISLETSWMKIRLGGRVVYCEKETLGRPCRS